MTELPRYYVYEWREPIEKPDGPWMKAADVSSRLQQLENENGMLIEKLGGLGATCDDALLRAEQSEAQLQQLEQEKANLHAECHDLVCNGNPAYPRGAKGVGCSCRGREQRDAAALAETREALQQLTEKYELLLSRVVETGIAEGFLPQPPLGDTSTDR